MALVKELVELLEGEIEVQSILRQGTTFELQLPIQQNTVRQVLEGNEFFIEENTVEEETKVVAQAENILPNL